MINFEEIEYFFASCNSHDIPFELDVPKAPKKTILQKAKAALYPPKKPVPAPIKKPEFRQATIPEKAPPKKKEEDSFYKQWSQKYKSLQAENLLAKEPLKRHALFIIDKKTPKEFAEKIAGAINTRIMKTTLIVHNGPIDSLLNEYEPTHLIYTKEFSTTSPLPTISIDDLRKVEKDATQKRALWETLKEKLKA